MVMGHSLGLQTGKKRHDKSWTTIIETGNLGSVANSGCVDCEPKQPKQAKDGKKRKESSISHFEAQQVKQCRTIG